MPVLNKACFCFQLQTGGVILGWLGVIGAALSILASLIGFGFLVQISEVVTEQKIENDEIPPALLMFITVILIGFALLNVIALAASICLVTGAIKRKRLLVLPWLVSEIFSITILGIFLIFDFASLFFENGESTGQKFVSFILSAFFLVFDVYLWLCIYSLYQSIKEEEKAAPGVSEMVNQTATDGLPPYKSFA